MKKSLSKAFIVQGHSSLSAKK
jgi:hypothetical protein